MWALEGQLGSDSRTCRCEIPGCQSAVNFCQCFDVVQPLELPPGPPPVLDLLPPVLGIYELHSHDVNGGSSDVIHATPQTPAPTVLKVSCATWKVGKT